MHDFSFKNVYIDKLDDIVNKDNNTCHSTTKMKRVDVKSTHILILVNKLIIKTQNLKLVIMLEYQNIKMFLQKDVLQIGLKKFLWLKKLKNTVLWIYTISGLKEEAIVGTFYENEL